MKQLRSLFAFIIILLALVTTSCASDRTLTISATPNNYGTVSGAVSPSGGTYKNGAEVTLVANPANNNYEFSGWAGDISNSTNRITIKMNSNKNIVATFKIKRPYLQLSVSPSGSGTLDPNSGSYDAGNQIKITATPKDGFRFVQWGGSATGNTNPLSVLMDMDKTITANFIKQYKLTVVPTSGGTVSPNGGIYDSGTVVKLTATPVFPYSFENWAGADDKSINPTTAAINADNSVSVTTKVTMTSNKSVSMNFVQLTKKTLTPIQKAEALHSQLGTVPIDLNQYEWVEGTIDCGTFPQLHVYIQGPDGKNIKDFGSIGQANFRIMAPISGKYSVIVVPNGVYGGNYNVTYTVYGLQ
jgi:hypothetical protein